MSLFIALFLCLSLFDCCNCLFPSSNTLRCHKSQHQYWIKPKASYLQESYLFLLLKHHRAMKCFCLFITTQYIIILHPLFSLHPHLSPFCIKKSLTCTPPMSVVNSYPRCIHFPLHLHCMLMMYSP